MRIGLFSDTYLPAVNGISYVLEIMYNSLTDMGHEVYIFAPAPGLRAKRIKDHPGVIRFPAIEGIFFDEQLTSIFFPPSAMRKIKKLDLDVIHFFTPGQIGLMGVYAAIRQDIPLVGQYSTDLYRYVEKYPNTLPATIALNLAAPFILRLTPREIIRLLEVFKPRRTITSWHKNAVARVHVILHDQCDAVIALSRKMQKQLDSWGSKTPTTFLPTGVDPIHAPREYTANDFKNEYNFNDGGRILLYVGRLSAEKNIELLINAFPYLARKHNDVKLVLVGDFEYRSVLERLARDGGYNKRIIFTGRIPRERLGSVYACADIFVFPSVTDTQGLVINEAAGAGLPIVLCDEDVSEVFIAGKTGLLAPDHPARYAEVVGKLLNDKKLSQKLGTNAKKEALKYSEMGQIRKLEKLYNQCLNKHNSINSLS